MYAHIIKHCLVYFCVDIFEVSKNHDPKRKLRYTSASCCSVGSEEKLYYFCYDSNQDNCHP